MSESLKQVRVGIAVVICQPSLFRETGRYLMGKRKNSHGAGKWAYAGGHLEFGEGLVACAMREVREECGEDLKVKLTSFTNPFFQAPEHKWMDDACCITHVSNDIIPGEDGPREDKHYITLYLYAKHLSGEPVVMEPEKCEEWKWFTAADIHQMHIDGELAPWIDPHSLPSYLGLITPDKQSDYDKFCRERAKHPYCDVESR